MLQAFLSGLVPGSAYAMIAVAIVLAYRMTGTLNFTTTVVGVLGCYTLFALTQGGTPVGVALFAAILLSALCPVAVGWLMASVFSESSATEKATVTISVLLGLLALGLRIFGDRPRPVPQFLPDWALQINGVTLSSETLLAITLSILSAIVLTLALERSRLGMMLRAMAERPTTAIILQVPVAKLSLLVWAVVGVLAAIAVILAAPTRNSSFLSLTLLLIPGLAAALIGLYRNFFLALAGGLAIGTLEGLATAFPAVAPFRSAIPFVVIVAVLLWSQRKEVWDAPR